MCGRQLALSNTQGQADDSTLSEKIQRGLTRHGVDI
jgi:hypothetical protein